MRLIPVTFAYMVDAVPHRGRQLKRMRFIDATHAPIGEVTPSEVASAYVMPAPENISMWSIGDRLFRRARLMENGDDIPLPQWLLEIASPMGNHTLPNGSAGHVMPDLLDLRRGAGLRQPTEIEKAKFPDRPYPEECLWPTGRIEDINLRSVVESFHENARTAILRNAERLKIAGDGLYVESGEPVWHLRLIGLPDGRTNVVHLTLADHREISRDIEEKRSSRVPFADYRMYRIDRTDDLVEDLENLQNQESPRGLHEAISLAKTATVIRHRADGPALDVTTPMLARLADKIHSTASALMPAATRDRGLFRTIADALDGHSPLRQTAHAIEIGEALRDLRARLTDRTVRIPPDGNLTRLINAVTPALAALERDLSSGIIAPPDFDQTEIDALDELA